MDSLYTKIKRPNYPFKITYQDRITFLGSCFSNNIGNKFEERKFRILKNPFGTIFNPYSTFFILNKIIKNDYFEDNEWFFFNEKWRHLQLHSDCSCYEFDKIKNFRNYIDDSNKFIKESNYLFITLGTSWIYIHNKTNEYVGNCHKIPQNNFTKKLLSIKDITQKGESVFSELMNINSDIKIILTVSPVRYLSFGAYENSISKSHIFSAINNWITNFNNIFYFPSYELFIDEMRDYRFYSNDLLHPNDLGLDYLWKFISNIMFNEETLNNIKEIESIIKFKNHKVFNYNSENYKKSLEHISDKEKKIKDKYNFINF